MTVAVLFSATALLGYIILMALTLRRNWRSEINRSFATYLGTMAIWQFAALMVSRSTDVENALIWYRIMSTGLGGQFIFYLFFILVFLRIAPKPYISITGWLLFFALVASTPTGLVISSVSKSEATSLFIPSFGPLVPLVGISAYLFLGYAIVNLATAYRRTKSVQHRNRIRYLLLGACVIGVGTLSNLFSALQAYPVDVLANILNAFLIAYTILRHNLLDLSEFIRTGLLYSIPTVIIGASYFFLIALTVTIFHEVTGKEVLIASLVLAVVVAIIAQPLRDRAQFWVDQLFFREKYNSTLLLQNLSRMAASELNLDNLANMILDQLTQTIHISTAAFFLWQIKDQACVLTTQRGLDDLGSMRLEQTHPIVEWFITHDDALTQSEIDTQPQFKSLWGAEYQELEKLGSELFIPVKTKGELVAILVLGAKRSEQIYSANEILTLTMLANQIAVAIENARLYRDLEVTIEALRQAHDELEDRVQQRTSDLAQVNLILKAEVSERKRAEEAIQHYASELERSNRELQQFAYVASHDLQEPLRMVSSFLQLLEKRYQNQLDQDAIEFISFAVDGAKRMQALINGLLIFSRVGTQGNPFTLVDCQALLTQVLDNLKIAIQETRAEIISTSLPTVMGDGTQLTQVFQNLIANAIKFHGEKPPHIEIGAEHRENEWLLWVTDNGIGIDPQYAERIFLIFQRLHTRHEYPGTGIGLAICKRIIERHGGRIWMESDPASGKPGSTFYFTIPDNQDGEA